MSKEPITAEGYKRAQEDLGQYLKVERPKIIKEIEVARSHGDLKENAEYHAAKEKQSLIEGKIQAFNAVLADSVVVDISQISNEEIQFGSWVEYVDLNSEDTYNWQLVGKFEANTAEKKISISSPIGRALLGKGLGDEAVIKMPKGEMLVEITKIY